MKRFLLILICLVYGGLSLAADEWDVSRCQLGYGQIAGTGTVAHPPLANLEKRLMEVATTAPKGGLYGRMRDLFAPLHDRVKKLLEFNELNSARRYYAAELKALLQERNEHLSPEESAKLGRLHTEIQAEIDGVDAELKGIYGDKEPETRDDVYAAYGKVKNRDLNRETANFLTRADERFEAAMKLFDAARARRGLPERTLAEMSPRELQFRHMGRLRETLGAQAVHDRAVSHASPHDITVHYTYDDSYSTTSVDSKGNLTTQYHYRTGYGSNSHHASYAELLTGQINQAPSRGTVSSVSGVDAARAASAQLRAHEGGYYRKLEDAQRDLFASVRDNRLPGSNRASLEATLAGLKQYAAWDEAKVKQQWAGDDYARFKERTGTLVGRYEALLKYDELYRQQIKRGGAVVARPLVADYKPEMTELQRQAKKNGNILLASLLGGLGTGLAGGGYALFSWQTSDDEKRRAPQPAPPVAAPEKAAEEKRDAPVGNAR